MINMKTSVALMTIIILMGIKFSLAKEGFCLISKYKEQYWYLEDYSPKGSVNFNVTENHKYVFKVYLTDKQYAFMLKGDCPFIFSIIEPSGYNWGMNYSDKNKDLIVFSNIMEKGEYIIEVYSSFQNNIYMEWGYY